MAVKRGKDDTEIPDASGTDVEQRQDSVIAEIDHRTLAREQRNRIQEALLEMESIDDLNAILTAAADGGYLQSASEALGILSVEHKSKLEGQNCVFLGWQFNETDKYPGQSEFVSVMFVHLNEQGTQIVGKGVFNDGSTGVYAQLRGLTDRRLRSDDETLRRLAFGPLPVPKGLRASTYDALDDEGNVIARDAQTFYIKG